MQRCRRSYSGFTLVELLVVLAMISLLAAILLPVLAQGREKARQSACLSNMRSIGLGVMQYVMDYDDSYPNGMNYNGSARIWPGEGWAGQCMGYIKSPALFRCPSDATSNPGAPNDVESFGYNINFAGYVDEAGDPPTVGEALSDLTAPVQTVMLFEVSNVLVNLAEPHEGAYPGGALGVNFSAAGNGLDNRLYAQENWSTSPDNKYATGLMGGRFPFNPTSTQFADAAGRHFPGATFLLADGHARWLQGSSVSSGRNAPLASCNQDNAPPIPGCGTAFDAAGTGSASNRYRVTFSVH